MQPWVSWKKSGEKGTTNKNVLIWDNSGYFCAMKQTKNYLKNETPFIINAFQ